MVTTLPGTFLTHMQEILGTDYNTFLESYNNEPVRGIRINQLKVKTKTLGVLPPSPHKGTRPLDPGCMGEQLRFSGATSPVCWCGDGFVYDSSERPSKSVGYHAGLFYIQEPSAMCPAEVLDAQPGHRVLDLCAAPGGKSVQIAGHLQGEGLLMSNDASPSRSRALVKNLERAGVTNAVVTTEQPKKLAERFPDFFDRILVDAPCSGEGMFRRDPDAIKAYTANKPEACAAVQQDILRHAAKMLKPGGRLVYSTCTFNTQENEGTITTFLQSHDDFTAVQIDHSALGIQPARDPLPQAARIWPHLANGEGHFVALLEKKESNIPDFVFLAKSIPPLEFTAFIDDFLCMDFPQNAYVLHGINLYLQPVALHLSGIRVARSGWHLGECTKGRFVPSQALAMGLRKEQARYAVELSEEDAFRYLRGESLFHSEAHAQPQKPWILICHDGHPLGWARLVQGRLKNNLPVGWAVSS
ncbi:MAG: RsmF rRNA methyltransferase first C-terminal domain-containing protein [Defluviitaleaceae bacterium]|nr:RsmF rRNA methyltransferase first C-terminal domain-containing protein [Defluviitaleaceae bacterium]